ncbi:hypothetical protein MLD52_23145, partial [Puniceicoccaceae bacterium K14]|nr:hypothetical protein [Puniceicoccaceae bacterium K14]
AYDELRQLSSVNGNLAEAYLYDLSGNRLTADIGATNLVYEPNGLNQYTSIELDGEAVPFEPSYDLNGSQLQSRSRGSGEVSQYTWDELNRLVSVEVGDHTQVSFHYDGLGRRVRKDVSTWDSSLSLFTLHIFIFSMDFKCWLSSRKPFPVEKSKSQRIREDWTLLNPWMPPTASVPCSRYARE